MNNNPVPWLAVLQRYAARHLDGLHGSDLRLHVSPQNMQCNIKTNEDNSESHNLFRGGGSLFNLHFTPTSWRCMTPTTWRCMTPTTWHCMTPTTWRCMTPTTWRCMTPTTWRCMTPTTWRCIWVLHVYEETELLWHLMVKVKSSSKWLMKVVMSLVTGSDDAPGCSRCNQVF